MTAKKAQKNAVNETIVMTPEWMKLPTAKAFLKELKAAKEKSEMENTLSPVVAAANNALGQKFETFAQVVKYVAKKTAKSIKKKKFSPDEVDEIVKLRNEGKRPKEIAVIYSTDSAAISKAIHDAKKNSKK
jgi:hypothetical protein